MTITITLIIIYLVSVIGAYKTIQNIKSKENKEILQSFMGFVITFMPFANTFVSVFWVFDTVEDYFSKYHIDWDKFFNRW